jgi:hypothetical protein
MKALINPQVEANRVTGYVWSDIKKKYTEISELIPNSALVCDFHEQGFEVAPPLFWFDCDSTFDTFFYFYNKSTKQIEPINHAEPPNVPASEQQPPSDGLVQA